MEEFIIFVCTESTESFFSKLSSAGLNYKLPSFFTESYCVGVSNEHCSLTFFIFVELRQLFPYMAFVYAWIVPLWADHLLLQLLMEQFDTLPIQCRHIEHMHEGVFNFCLHRFY